MLYQGAWGVTTSSGKEVIRSWGHYMAIQRHQIQLDIGHWTPTITLQVTLGPTAVPAWPFPLPVAPIPSPPVAFP